MYCVEQYSITQYNNMDHKREVAQLVETPCHKTEGAGFDSWCGPWNLSSDLILLFASSIPGVHSGFNRNEYQGISLGVK